MVGEYGTNSRLYIIPQDEENRVILLNADRSTKEEIRRRFSLYEEHDWECNTIANNYIEVLIRSLAVTIKEVKNPNTEIDFFGLFFIRVSVKRNEDAEKEGNINIIFTPGPEIEKIITDETPRENREFTFISPEALFVQPDDEARTAYYLKMDKVTKLDLQNKYDIIAPKDWMVTAIAYTFMINLIRELMYKLALSDKTTVSVNFNDNIEIHATRDKATNEVTIAMRPGMSAKLIIKSDETTESEDDDE